jgi:hypothetical protein
MKNIWNIIFIILGLIGLIISLITYGAFDYFSFISIVIIAVGIWGMFFDSRNPKTKFNFRETNNYDNCNRCNRFDKKSSDGFVENCKFFHIKTDRNHVCDLLCPQSKDETDNKSYIRKANKPEIIKHEDLLRKMR